MNFIADFTDRNIVVTGATAGIGWETARRYIDAGGNVIAVARNQEKGKELERYAVSAKGSCAFFACDFQKPDSIESLGAEILERFPRIDILINCAGIIINKTILDMTVEEWDAIFNVNVKATFLMCRAFLPGMLKARSGHIVNIGSTAAFCGANNLHAYASTKGAVVQLTRSLAADYSERGVIVNCVCPGATNTDMMNNGDSPEQVDEFTKRFPVGRYAEPREIANVILFASSDEASNMAGSIIMDDGGFSAI